MLKKNKLNMCCGNDKKKGWINADVKGTEPLIDFNVFPYPFLNNQLHMVYIRMALEHLSFPDKVLSELWHCCKKDAVIEIITTHYTNKGSYNSLEHKAYFDKLAFDYFVEDNKKKFELIYSENMPTNIGKLIPEIIRKKLALFMNGIYGEIHVKLKVIK